MIEIELPDGTVLEAPDDADPSVVARNYMAKQGGQQTPQNGQQTERRSLGQDVVRQGKMLGLEAVKGATRFVTMPLDAANELIGIAKRVGEGDKFSDIFTLQGAVSADPNAPSRTLTDPITSIQPQPETGLERVATATSGALGGAAAGIGAGRALAGTALEQLAVEPGRQAVGAGAGGSGAQLTAEAGGGPTAQTIVGLGAGLASSGAGRSGVAEGVKRSFRGGEQGRQRVAENVRAFEDAGSTPSAGQATQNRRLQSSESLLSRAPGGAGVMAQRAERQAEQIGSGIERQATKLSPKASAEQAGRSIRRGITDEGGFMDQFKNQSKNLYDKIDDFVPPETRVAVSNTQKTLDNLTKVTKGAEATTGRLVNRRIQEIKEDLNIDAQDGAIPYEALKQIRTRVGDELADSALMSDVPTAQWKQLYGALSRDLEAAAKSAGRQAELAYRRANNYYKAGQSRIDVLESVIDKNGGPEAIFRAATSGTKEGATTLRAVMQSLPDDARKTLSATVLRRLGRAKPGQQDDLGEAFSTETFLTNWNAMSREAKAVLFNRYGPEFRKDMDQVAKVASNLREGSQVFRNPSGTAQASIQYTTAGAFLMSLMTGNVGTASAIGAGVGASNLAARLMTHPPFVKWLAKTTRRPVEATPVLINQLAQSENPVLQEAAEFLQQGPDQQNNQGNRGNPEQDAGN